MKEIDYAVPKSVSETVSLLAEKGNQARCLAGGTDILVQLRGGRRSVELVVDVKEVPETNLLSYDPQKGWS